VSDPATLTLAEARASLERGAVSAAELVEA
jgi:hypothetical protein